MKLTRIGMDIAKQTFDLHGVDRRGKLVLRRTAAALRCALAELLEGNDERITAVLKAVVAEQFERFKYLAQRLDSYDRQIGGLCKQDHRCRRLLQVPGIGPLSATALVAALATATSLKTGVTSVPIWGWCRATATPATRP
jgi:transposase